MADRYCNPCQAIDINVPVEFDGGSRGTPKVIEMLKDGDAEPIWNLSDSGDWLFRTESSLAGDL